MKIEFESIELNLKYLLLDYTGTLSEHGKLIECVKERIKKLTGEFEKILILTADTFKTAEKELKDLPVEITILKEKSGIEKRRIANQLNGNYCVAIGNGNNDIEMFKASKLSLAVINRDGCNAKLITYADLVFKSICDALDALSNPKIIISLLRE